MTETIQGSFIFSAGTNINSRYMFKWMSKYVFGTEAENTQCLGSVFLSFSLCSFPVHSLWLSPFPHSRYHESKSFLYFNLQLMAESFLRNFFLHIPLTRKESGAEMRGYVISGKCLKLQIKPVSTICRNIRPARVLFPPNPFSHP